MLTAYMENLHFHWPESLDAVYQTRQENRLSLFTEDFRSKLYDHNSWTMGRAYVALFPETLGMICVHEPVSSPLSTTDGSQGHAVASSRSGALPVSKIGRGTAADVDSELCFALSHARTASG